MLVLEGETRVNEALGDQVGGVVGAGGIEEEVLVVDCVRVDVIEFECGHVPMVGPARRDGMRVARGPGPPARNRPDAPAPYAGARWHMLDG